MKTFSNACAQGDTYFKKIDALPKGVLREPAINNKVIVAHSETGHHHVMDADVVEMYRLPDSIYECFLVVKEPAPLEHLRPHDSHEPILFPPGVYNVKRQREYTPEGWRRVAD